MPADKRKAVPSKAVNAKQKTLVAVKEEKSDRPEGWLQDQVDQQRREKKDVQFNKKRLRFLSQTQKIKQGSEAVLYWMSRDHRVQGDINSYICIFMRNLSGNITVHSLVFIHGSDFFLLDNWALIHAQQLALAEKLPLYICYCLEVPKTEVATIRHHGFLLKGLEKVANVREGPC